MKPHPRARKAAKWAAAAASILLFVLWIGSGWVTLNTMTRSLGAWSVAEGRLLVEPYVGSWTTAPLWPAVRPEVTPFNLRWGLAHTSPFRIVILPLWIPFLLVFIPTARVFSRDVHAWRLARRRARMNFCTKCGYDRTGLPPNSVCPECGAASSSPQ